MMADLCQVISWNAPLEVQLAKESIHRGLTYEAGLDRERIAGALLYDTDSTPEWIEAYIYDREPRFTGQ